MTFERKAKRVEEWTEEQIEEVVEEQVEEVVEEQIEEVMEEVLEERTLPGSAELLCILRFRAGTSPVCGEQSLCGPSARP